MGKVLEIVSACNKREKRVRDLPSALVVYYVIALSLFPGVGYQSVLQWLLSGLQWLGSQSFRVATKQSLSAARHRLGDLPMQKLHECLARPLAEKSLPGSHFKDWLLVAMDGSTLALQDTGANSKTFGRSSNQNGEGAWPMARFVALVECGTRLIFGAAMGSYRSSEVVLAKSLVPSLGKGMLCMAERLFLGYELWRQCADTGAHLLWRAKTSLKLKKIQSLPDGSYLAHWLPQGAHRKGDAPLVVRVIEYRLHRGEAGKISGGPDFYRLLTTVLDCAAASAEELAALYPHRWQIEIAIKEGKTIKRNGTVTLRSKTPELVRQEFWGMILAHYLVRKMMAQAALDRKRAPDELSYEGCIEIVKSTQTGPVLRISP
jgi:hypothetical protein